VGAADGARGSGVDLVWEVFRQERKGQPFQHAGSIVAPNAAFADWYAREQYGRRGESVALWVVPREAVHEIEDFVDELKRNYHRVDGYPLKEKLAKARERAGTA
jgi:ring-1,2-phenylacetyl-CoA epoxidase subunit PaaB